MLIDLSLPPGAFRNGTAYQARGRFYDVNRVRWSGAALAPIGGWRLKTTDGDLDQIKTLDPSSSTSPAAMTAPASICPAVVVGSRRSRRLDMANSAPSPQRKSDHGQEDQVNDHGKSDPIDQD